MKTEVRADTRLALTCSREGACCHGNAVWLNPWELACLAAAQGLTPAAFRDASCAHGGIRLRFDGPDGWRGRPACQLYDPDSGCTVHPARPLACRLYPLARELRGDAVAWVHAGTALPCLASCPGVTALPEQTVAAYLAGQQVELGETAQDAYLEVMQALADGALVLLLDSGLAASGDRETLRRWRALGDADPDERAARIPAEWLDRLVTPSLTTALDDPLGFAQEHEAQLQRAAQAAFATLADASSLVDAASLMMALALQLGRGLGADPTRLAARWIATARQHGAR